MDSDKVKVLRWILSKLYRSREVKKDLEERLHAINQERNSPIGGISYDPMPRASGLGEGAAGIVLKLSDCEERIIAQREEIDKEIIRVMDIMELIPDQSSVERRICELRYLDNNTWEEIARKIPMSRSQCHYIESNTLSNLLDNPWVMKIVDDNMQEYQEYSIKYMLRHKNKVGSKTG